MGAGDGFTLCRLVLPSAVKATKMLAKAAIPSTVIVSIV